MLPWSWKWRNREGPRRVVIKNEISSILKGLWMLSRFFIISPIFIQRRVDEAKYFNDHPSVRIASKNIFDGRRINRSDVQQESRHFLIAWIDFFLCSNPREHGTVKSVIKQLLLASKFSFRRPKERKPNRNRFHFTHNFSYTRNKISFSWFRLAILKRDRSTQRYKNKKFLAFDEAAEKQKSRWRQKWIDCDSAMWWRRSVKVSRLSEARTQDNGRNVACLVAIQLLIQAWTISEFKAHQQQKKGETKMCFVCCSASVLGGCKIMCHIQSSVKRARSQIEMKFSRSQTSSHAIENNLLSSTFTTFILKLLWHLPRSTRTSNCIKLDTSWSKKLIWKILSAATEILDLQTASSCDER